MNEKEERPSLAGEPFEKPAPGTIDTDIALVRWVKETVKKLDAYSNPGRMRLI